MTSKLSDIRGMVWNTERESYFISAYALVHGKIKPGDVVYESGKKVIEELLATEGELPVKEPQENWSKAMYEREYIALLKKLAEYMDSIAYLLTKVKKRTKRKWVKF